MDDYDDTIPDSQDAALGDSTPITFERALEILRDGAIDVEHGVVRWSSNYTFLISVTHDDDSVMGIYKPQQGERPLWDFPDGTLCYRERASFLTSEALGWRLVPPTVLREGPRGLGSVQFYVDHDPEYHFFSFEDEETFIPHLMRMALFDYLVNNADRKGGHCLVDAGGNLWGIDHGITFNAAHKLRTVIWNFAGQPAPAELLADVEKLCGQLDDAANPFMNEIHDLLNSAEIRAFDMRIRNLLESGIFPTPGPGPNYPWPPV